MTGENRVSTRDVPFFLKVVAGVFPSAVHTDVLMLTSTDPA